MTKPNSIMHSPPKKRIFNPQSGYVRPILKIETTPVGDIDVMYSKNRKVKHTNNLTCCTEDIVDSVREEILDIELQLSYDSYVTLRLLQEQGRLDERAALMINMGLRSDELALKFSSLYKGELNKKLAIDLIYRWHSYMYYGMAVTCLMRIIENPIYANKALLAKLLTFAHGKELAISTVLSNKEFIRIAHEEGKQIDKLLITLGLGELIEPHIKVEGFEIRHDKRLPCFSPITTFSGKITKMFSSRQTHPDERSSTKTEHKITNKMLMS